MQTLFLRYLFLTFCLFYYPEINSQDLYKTPSGEKYHLSTCRMVKNVSAKIITPDGIIKLGLEPCKICQPPVQKAVVKSYSGTNKAVGEGDSVQCKGKTALGTRCQPMSRIAKDIVMNEHASKNKN